MATCVCVLYAEGNSGVSGSITMSQTQEDGPTVIEGTIRGLTPGQRHGISVCAYGDVRDGSTSTGTIFNPFGMYHEMITDRTKYLDATSTIGSNATCVTFRSLT